jgi:hypothetical protein
VRAVTTEELDSAAELATEAVDVDVSFPNMVELFVKDLCEFGEDSHSLRKVDRYRLDRTPLYLEFERRNGKCPRLKFYQAVLGLEGVTHTNINRSNKITEGFSGIRLKERVADDGLMRRFMDKKCERGDEEFMIGRSELFDVFTAFVREEDESTPLHRGVAVEFKKLLEKDEGVVCTAATWRRSWGNVYVGIRPTVGYPTASEVLKCFFVARTETAIGESILRPLMLKELSKFIKTSYNKLPINISGDKLTRFLSLKGVKTTSSRGVYFQDIALRPRT